MPTPVAGKQPGVPADPQPAGFTAPVSVKVKFGATFSALPIMCQYRYWTIVVFGEPTESEVIRFHAGCPAVGGGGVTVGNTPLASGSISIATTTRLLTTAGAKPAETLMRTSPV